MMKKSCRLFLLGAALATTMTISAAAANFTSSADALNQMGLFSGTGSGYELDRAPTRAEAAVMLVRLLGGEKDATQNSYQTPFTDVPGWAAPYVGWLYHNGLTAGATATSYGTNDRCTAQMYSTFLLRSLGYKDSGNAADFQYAGAVDFAMDKGVADYANCDEDNFLRDHVVAMSYTALSVQPRDGKNDTLLDQLIASGAVDTGKAAKSKANFAAYKEYMALSEKQANTDSMAMTMKASLDMKMNDAPMMNMLMDMDVKAKMDLNKMDQSKLAMNGKITLKLADNLVEQGQSATQTTDMAVYYTNGIYYIKTGTDKYKMPMSFEEMMSSMNLDMMETMPISMFDGVTKNSDGSYKISYATGFMNDMIGSVLGSMGVAGDQDATTIEKFDMVVTPKNGQISTMKANINCSTTVEGQKMDMVAVIDYTITAMGDQVTVTLPTDLSTYIDMPAV